MDNLSGKLIKGYHLQRKLGEGGFGTVYQARQTSVARDVAIKVIHSKFANQPDFIRRFEAEAQTIARLEHLHIVPLYDYWREPDGTYLVMRYLSGGSLRDITKEDGALSVQHANRLLQQIATALEFAHDRRIIHRDLKPENILMDEDGNAYLADFGIAKNLDLENGPTMAEEIVGSLDYISPEQARSQSVTARTDVYSLGVVLYEMLTGTHPWPELSSVERLYKHIHDPLPEISNLDNVNMAALNTVIQKATAKNPENRYPSSLSLASAFQQEVVGADALNNNLVTQLTQREQEVLQAIIAGQSNREIADAMFIEASTVKWHIRQLYRKLGVKSRVQAIVMARDLNLIASGDAGQEQTPVKLSTSVIDAIENPYKGLQAFTTADALDFYGRDKLVNKLVNHLDRERFLAVVGPSGSGKSSVVKAGLIPALWRGSIAGSDRWFVVELLPGLRPLDQLEIALTRVAADQSNNIGTHLKRDANGLLRCADLILPQDGSELVIVLDQFEEVFTLLEDEAERQHLLDLLRAAVSDPHSRVRVIVTLRADFYDRPLRYPEFGALLRANMETILPLSVAELEQVIVEPAKRLNVTYEPGLVMRIVGDVSYQAGALPLLQYALTELFDRREGLQIKQDAYTAIGGAVGALAQRAETTFREMTPEGQAATRQMFLRLVTLGEGVEDTRRRTPRAELLAIADESDLMDEIIDTFAAYRLLSLDYDAKTRIPTVEVAHEAILREWNRLLTWLDESRADIRLERVLAHNTKEWMDHGRDTSYLLHGSRLEQFEAWAAVTDVLLTPEEHSFITASLAIRAQHLSEEQARQQHAAILETRSQQRTRYLMVVLVLLALGAVVFALYALDREQQTQAALSDAEAARATSVYNMAVAQELALVNGARVALAEDDLDTALVLAATVNRDNSASLSAQAVLAQAAYRIGGTAKAIPVDAWRVVLHPNGASALTVPFFGREKVLWDLDTGAMLQSYGTQDVNGELAVSGDISPNGQIVAYGLVNNTIVLYETETGEEIARLETEVPEPELAAPLDINFSPDGQTLLIGYSGIDFSDGHCTGLLVLWDVQFRQVRQTYSDVPACQANIGFSSDGSTAIVAGGPGMVGQAGTITLVDVASGAVVTTLGGDGHGHQAVVNDAVFSHDGLTVVSVGWDAQLIFWDVESATPLAVIPNTVNEVSNATLSLSPDGRYISLTSNFAGQQISIYDLETHTVELTLNGDYHIANRAVFSPDGRQIISVGSEGPMRIFDLYFGAELSHSVVDAPPEIANGVWSFPARNASNTRIVFTTLSPDILAGPTDYPVNHGVFDLSDGSLVDLYQWNDVYNARGSVFIDDKHLITGLEDGTLIVWDVLTGSEIRRLQSPVPGLRPAQVAGGKLALALEVDRVGPGLPVVVIDVESGVAQQFRLDNQGIIDLRLTPQGDRLLTSSGRGPVAVWDVASGRLLQEVDLHPQSWTLIGDINAEGTEALTFNSGELIRWSIETGSALQRYLTGPSLSPFPAFFTPEGILFSGEEIKLLDIKTGEVVRTFSEPTARLVLDVTADRRILVAQNRPQFTYAWTWWRLDSPKELLSWATNKRYLRDLTCEERILYRIEPRCDE